MKTGEEFKDLGGEEGGKGNKKSPWNSQLYKNSTFTLDENVGIHKHHISSERVFTSLGEVTKQQLLSGCHFKPF